LLLFFKKEVLPFSPITISQPAMALAYTPIRLK
jgi:hypothetical protein